MFCLYNITIILYLLTLYITVESMKEYGPFNITVTKALECKGPKRKECSNFSMQIISNVTITYDLLIKENVPSLKGKIKAYTRGKFWRNIEIPDPCHDLFYAPFFRLWFNMTNDCIINKGRYQFSIDMQQFLHKYYAANFVYGDWSFKTILFNDQCNFSCSILTLAIIPREINTPIIK